MSNLRSRCWRWMLQFSGWFVWLFLLVAFSTGTSRGDEWYLLQGVDKQPSSAELNHPKLDGTSIRVRWKTLEPTLGNYRWDYLHSQVLRARERNLKYMIRVMAGWNAPDHSYSSQTSGIPTPWDPLHQQRFEYLMAAIANRYSSDPKLVCVHVPGYWKSAEFHLPNGNFPGTLMVQAWLHRFTITAAAFPAQQIALNHSPNPWSNHVLVGAKQIAPTRVAFQMNALKANTAVHWEGYWRIRDLGLAGECVGWQFVCPSTNVPRFGGTWRQALEKGLAGAPTYWEVYAADLSRIP